MSERTKRLMEMAKDAYKNIQEDESEDDPEPLFSSDSEDDPTYACEDSMSTSESSSDNDVPVSRATKVSSEVRSVQIQTESVPNISDEWTDPVGRHERFSFDGSSGVSDDFIAGVIGGKPVDFFLAFFDDKIIQCMVDETNVYAAQILLSGKDVSEHSRLRAWQPTTVDEMKKFIGILGYMGIVHLPTIRHYWTKRPLFGVSILGQVMSRNRFQILLQMWHFSNNESCPMGDRIFKIQPFLNLLVKKYQGFYTPGSTFCIDETQVPFRGRLKFRQFNPQKSHKYGIKLFKLCSDGGYTWNVKIYCGREQAEGISVPTSVVLKLSEKLLMSGRTAVTDNYYTSIELANRLLDKKTHLLGTLRRNRKGNPKVVLKTKLKIGEIVGKENERGICIMKWKDRRDVIMLSTKHTTTTVEVNRRSGAVNKPRAVVEYNKGKSDIDLSDQLARYNSALRRTLKWYRKLAVEFIWGTSLVNAHFLYKSITQTNISITQFRESVVEDLLLPQNEVPVSFLDVPVPKKQKMRLDTHGFQKKEGKAHLVRKYCRGYYEKKMKGKLAKNNVRKVTTFCKDCDENPHFCLQCFAEYHNK